MEKRYQVFVSSTFADPQEERQAVMQALLSLDHFPAGMELFPASDDDAWTLIQGVIDDSDCYVLVVGGRYGSTNDAGVSYTEMEFDYALKTGKPILAFVNDAPELIPAGKTDQSDKLRDRLLAFKKRVEAAKHVKFWKNPDDLKAKVIQSVSAETRRNPQEGWVRSGRASDPVLTEQLRKEIDRLKEELNSVRTTPPAGSDRYAGGNDEFSVEFVHSTGTWSSSTTGRADVAVTWDDIFYELGPIMLEEATEKQMKSRLDEELWRYGSGTVYEQLQKANLGRNLSNESFETIKVQLLALGLTKRSERKHVPSDTEKYWSLTPFGETTLMTLRAIEKVNNKATEARA
jgi:hypothetical protein